MRLKLSLPLLPLALSLLPLAASAQSLRVCSGAVTIGVPATSADTLRQSGGTLTIMGADYSIADLDSIVYSTADVQPRTVFVDYDGTAARVLLSADVAPYLSVSVSGADVSIEAADDLAEEVTYQLAGTSADGSFLHVGSYKCTLALAGLSLTNTRGIAVDVQNGKRINVVLADGTTNVLKDAVGGEGRACLNIKGHVELAGSGTLTLTGQSRHALATGEYLLLDNGFKGSISILGAAGDGIHAEQYFDMRSGTITIAGCAGDGIDLETTNDPEEEYNGQVFISGGSVSIDLGAAEDVKGIKCDSLMTISGGAVNVRGSGDGVKGIKTSGNLLVNQSSGSAPTITINVTGTTYHKDLEDESKTRGIKVDGDFTFDGGNINISATGKKAKAIAVDGTYYYKSGTINCAVDATNIG